MPNRHLVKPLKHLGHYASATEAEYAYHLELLKRTSQIVDYRYEPMSLRLAKKTRYTPDFMVIFEDHIELHEVKGFWRDDARVKIKVTAEQFPWFKFIAVQKQPKRQGGGWKYEEF